MELSTGDSMVELLVCTPHLGHQRRLRFVRFRPAAACDIVRAVQHRGSNWIAAAPHRPHRMRRFAFANQKGDLS